MPSDENKKYKLIVNISITFHLRSSREIRCVDIFWHAIFNHRELNITHSAINITTEQQQKTYPRTSHMLIAVAKTSENFPKQCVSIHLICNCFHYLFTQAVGNIKICNYL